MTTQKRSVAKKTASPKPKPNPNQTWIVGHDGKRYRTEDYKGT